MIGAGAPIATKSPAPVGSRHFQLSGDDIYTSPANERTARSCLPTAEPPARALPRAPCSCRRRGRAHCCRMSSRSWSQWLGVDEASRAEAKAKKEKELEEKHSAAVLTLRKAFDSEEGRTCARLLAEGGARRRRPLCAAHALAHANAVPGAAIRCGGAGPAHSNRARAINRRGRPATGPHLVPTAAAAAAAQPRAPLQAASLGATASPRTPSPTPTSAAGWCARAGGGWAPGLAAAAGCCRGALPARRHSQREHPRCSPHTPPRPRTRRATHA